MNHDPNKDSNQDEIQKRDELLTRDLLGELHPEVSEEVERWCSEDPEFAAKREERREVIRLLREATPTSGGLGEDSRARLRRAAVRKSGVGSWLPGAAAAALLIGFFVIPELLVPNLLAVKSSGERRHVAANKVSDSAETPGEVRFNRPAAGGKDSGARIDTVIVGGQVRDQKKSPTVPTRSSETAAKGVEVLKEVFGDRNQWTTSFGATSGAVPPAEGEAVRLANGVGAITFQYTDEGISARSRNEGTIVDNPAVSSTLAAPPDLSKQTKNPRPTQKPESFRVPGDELRGRAIARGLIAENSEAESAAFERNAGRGGLTLGLPADGIEGKDKRGDLEHRISEAERIIAMLHSRPGETPDAMFFRFWGDNPFVAVKLDPLSTFGLDVDTASPRLCGSYIERGLLPPKAAVRTEEFINSNPIGIAAPQKDDLGMNIEVAPSRYSSKEGTRLVRIGIRAREIPDAQRKGLALTVVVDVSGSMKRENRLELVKQSLLTLVSELDGRDSIAIVAFQSTARLVLAPTSATDIDTIVAALGALSPGGSTNVQQGLELGYALALRHFKEGGNNHVALFSDGVANTGITDVDGLLGKTAEAHSMGIDLNSFGVGMGNHNDALLEQLADRGDGQCSYIDGVAQAVHLFRRNVAGLFQAVARDAKVQVEFDPETVVRFRQIGYENRAIADADFRNDAIDAGEIGAGQQVIALYEVEPRAGSEGNLGIVRLRWQPGSGGEFLEREMAIPPFTAEKYETSGAHFRLSAAVAAFAEILRGSYWARSTTLSEVAAEIESLVSLDTRDDTRVRDLGQLVRKAAGLFPGDATWAPNDVDRLVDELKRNRWMRSLLEDGRETRQSAQAEEVRKLADQLRKQNDDLEKRLRELLPG